MAKEAILDNIKKILKKALMILDKPYLLWLTNMSGENDYKITWLKPKYQLHSSNNIKPLMSNTELLNIIELTNIKKEYVMGCNMEIDGSKYPIHKKIGDFLVRQKSQKLGEIRFGNVLRIK
ncbi:hypothetical protein VN0017_11270 [Helicobacter pylori]